jgi:hypothetical protein
MAAPSAIFVRSPRIVEISGTASQTTRVELFLWNDPGSVPASATYTLSKPIPTSQVTSTYYDISPYCREYIAHSTHTEIAADTAAAVGEYCWVTVKTYKNNALQATSTYMVFDGFGYYEDGYNPSNGDVLLTEGTYYVSDTEAVGSLFYYDDGTYTWEAKYTSYDTGTTTVVLANTVGHVPLIHTSYIGDGGNKLQLYENSILQKTFEIVEVCESRYTIMECDFVNKFGVWQRLIFFKASQVNMTMDNKEYNLMPTSVNYTVTDATRQTFNINAKESVTCNTGWVVEGYSEVIKELLLSERILLNNEPVNVKSKSVKLQKSINDKTINYSIEFDYAHQMLNYVL